MRSVDFDSTAAHRLRIRTAGGTVLEGEQVRNVTLTSACCPEDGLTVGNVCSAQLKGVVVTDFDLLDTVLWAECVFDCGEDGIETLPLGEFRVTEWVRTEEAAEFTAYDRLFWAAGGEYTPNVSDAPTAAEVIVDIALIIGVEMEELPALAETTAVTGSLRGYSLRDMLGFMAALCGGNAVINRDGKLQILWFSAGGQVTEEELYSGGLSVKHDVGLVGMLVKQDSEDGTQPPLSVGVGSGYVMELENPFFTAESLQAVWEELSCLNTLTAELTGTENAQPELGSLCFMGGLCTEVGDLVTVERRDGSKTVLPAVQVVLELDGGAKCTVSADGQSQTEAGAQFQGVVGRTITRLQTDLGEFKQLVASQAWIDELFAGEITASGSITGAKLQSSSSAYGKGLFSEGRFVSMQEESVHDQWFIAYLTQGGFLARVATEEPDMEGAYNSYSYTDEVSISGYRMGIERYEAGVQGAAETLMLYSYGALHSQNGRITGFWGDELYEGGVSLSSKYAEREQWQELRLAAGIEANTSCFGGSPLYVPAYCRTGGMCRLAGSVSVTPSGSGTILLGTLPAGYRPNDNVYALVPCGGKNIARVFVNKNGEIKLEWMVKLADGTNHTAENWLQLNLSFPIEG